MKHFRFQQEHFGALFNCTVLEGAVTSYQEKHLEQEGFCILST